MHCGQWDLAIPANNPFEVDDYLAARLCLRQATPTPTRVVNDSERIGYLAVCGGNAEFEWAQQNLDLTIDRLDIFGAIDSPLPKLGDRFDSTDYHNCRELATKLLGDCQ